MRNFLIKTTNRTLCYAEVKNNLPDYVSTPNEKEIKKDKEVSELNEDLNRLGNDFRVDVNQQEESHEAKEEKEHPHTTTDLKQDK
jgi:hypothetical protein